MKQQIDAFEYAGHICKAMKKGILLTTKKDETVNTMTIGWGKIGIEWNKPVFIAYAHAQVYQLFVVPQCAHLAFDGIGGNGAEIVIIFKADNLGFCLQNLLCNSKMGYGICHNEASFRRSFSILIVTYGRFSCNKNVLQLPCFWTNGADYGIIQFCPKEV